MAANEPFGLSVIKTFAIPSEQVVIYTLVKHQLLQLTSNSVDGSFVAYQLSSFYRPVSWQKGLLLVLHLAKRECNAIIYLSRHTQKRFNDHSCINA